MNTKLLPQPRKVTLYFSGEMFGNYTKIEATAFDFEITNYAQYPSAVHAVFVPKRSRNVRGMWQTSHPSLVVLEGWGHPEPAPMMDEPERCEGSGLMTSRSRFSSFDPRWAGEFRGMLATHVEKSGARVVLDLHGYNAHAPFVGPMPPTPAERYAAEEAARVRFTHFDAFGDGCACDDPASHVARVTT